MEVVDDTAPSPPCSSCVSRRHSRPMASTQANPSLSNPSFEDANRPLSMFELTIRFDGYALKSPSAPCSTTSLTDVFQPAVHRLDSSLQRLDSGRRAVEGRGSHPPRATESLKHMSSSVAS